MVKKTIFGVMLAMVLAFGMTVVGCGPWPEPEKKEEENKFYSEWREAVEVNLVGLTSSNEIAGIVFAFPFSYLNPETGRTGNSTVLAIKIGSKWYSNDYNALLSKNRHESFETLNFTNTHYQTQIGLHGAYSGFIPYTFSETAISINGVDYPYTITEREIDSYRYRMLFFNGKYYRSLRSSFVAH